MFTFHKFKTGSLGDLNEIWLKLTTFVGDLWLYEKMYFLINIFSCIPRFIYSKKSTQNQLLPWVVVVKN